MPEIDGSEKRQGLHLACFRSTAVESKENFLAPTPEMPAKCESQANSPSFGVIGSAGAPRIAQVAVKVIF